MVCSTESFRSPDVSGTTDAGVDGANSLITYSCDDASPIHGRNAYGRRRECDIDGRSFRQREYSFCIDWNCSTYTRAHAQ